VGVRCVVQLCCVCNCEVCQACLTTNFDCCVHFWETHESCVAATSMSLVGGGANTELTRVWCSQESDALNTPVVLVSSAVVPFVTECMQRSVRLADSEHAQAVARTTMLDTVRTLTHSVLLLHVGCCGARTWWTPGTCLMPPTATSTYSTPVSGTFAVLVAEQCCRAHIHDIYGFYRVPKVCCFCSLLDMCYAAALFGPQP
jgi:hypothetical protein